MLVKGLGFRGLTFSRVLYLPLHIHPSERLHTHLRASEDKINVKIFSLKILRQIEQMLSLLGSLDARSLFRGEDDEGSVHGLNLGSLLCSLCSL